MTTKEIVISLLKITTTDAVSSHTADQIVMLAIELLKMEGK